MFLYPPISELAHQSAVSTVEQGRFFLFSKPNFTLLISLPGGSSDAALAPEVARYLRNVGTWRTFGYVQYFSPGG